MEKERLIENIKDSIRDDIIETLLFYMHEYRETFTPLEIARICFKEVCEYSIKLAYEVMEDMEDWA